MNTTQENSTYEASQQAETHQAFDNSNDHHQRNIDSTGDKNTNVGEVGGDVNIYTTEIPIKKEPFKDPTENFTLQEKPMPLHLDETALQKSLSEIYQDRIIFLGGKSGSNVVAILHELIKRYQSDTVQNYRWLSFWGKNNAQRDIYLNSVKEEAFPQNAVVAIDITRNKASDTFLKSIVDIPEQGAIEIKNTLREKNLVIICYFKGSDEELVNQQSGFHFWDTSPPIKNIQEFITEFDYAKLHSKDHSVFQYVLYIATFFPRTSPKEFKKMVDILLNEKKDEILAITREVGTQEAILKRTEEVKTRNLTYLWDQNTDDFFKECGLTIEYENDLQKVDFKDARDREAYKHYFKKKMPFFLLEQFDNLLNAHFPFAPDASDQAVEYFIQIACELAKHDPHFYGSKLLQIVSEMFKQFSEEETVLPEQTSKLQSFLVELVYAMLKLDNTLLTERIEFFLFEHLDYRYPFFKSQHSLLADIAFELKSLEKFNEYHWVETMMTDGKKKTKNSAHNLLLRLADSYKENTKDIHRIFFKNIRGWLPRRDKRPRWEEAELYDNTSNYALSFIIDYWGFYDLEKFNILADADLDFLVRWLFHPCLEIGYFNRSKNAALREIKNDGSKKGQALKIHEYTVSQVVNQARAILTEIWFQKLSSTEESNNNHDQKFVELIYKYTNPEQRLALVEQWHDQLHNYNSSKDDNKKRSLQSLKENFSKPLEPTYLSPPPPSNKGCLPFGGLFGRKKPQQFDRSKNTVNQASNKESLKFQQFDRSQNTVNQTPNKESFSLKEFSQVRNVQDFQKQFDKLQDSVQHPLIKRFFPFNKKR